MNKLKQLLDKLRTNEEGSASVAFIGIVVTLIVVIGLVVDSAGKYQLDQQAQMIASSAARAATNSISGETISTGSLRLNPIQAAQAAEAYVQASGMEGTVTINDQVVTVQVTDTYTTKFLSLIGIGSLPATGEASAQLITN